MTTEQKARKKAYAQKYREEHREEARAAEAARRATPEYKAYMRAYYVKRRGVCNYMKTDFTRSTFLAHCRRVASHSDGEL